MSIITGAVDIARGTLDFIRHPQTRTDKALRFALIFTIGWGVWGAGVTMAQKVGACPTIPSTPDGVDLEGSDGQGIAGIRNVVKLEGGDTYEWVLAIVDPSSNNGATLMNLGEQTAAVCGEDLITDLPEDTLLGGARTLARYMAGEIDFVGPDTGNLPDITTILDVADLCELGSLPSPTIPALEVNPSSSDL